MVLPLVKFFNIIFAALLAGTSFGIWLGFNPMNYSASTYIEQQQNLLHSLNTPLIALVIITTVFTLIAAFLQMKNKPVFVALLLAAAFFLSCMIITRLGNVPIQTQMLNWKKDALPGDWPALRDKWWLFHIMRTNAELIALVLIAWTTIQKKPPQNLSNPEVGYQQ
ncbi:MAG: anthrone oxygenase family protein [Ginsengibacter sp.]